MHSIIANSFFLVALAASVVQVQAQGSSQSWTTSIIPTTTAPPASSSTDNSALIKELRGASTAIDRFKLLFTKDGKLLPKDDLKKRVVFDFNNATANAGAKGGALKSAQVQTFPVLTGLGISTTMGFLNPCGMNSPHTHPRATEFLTVVEGEVDFGFIVENGLVAPENGSGEVTGNIKKFQGGVFPVGSIHYQVNPTCYPTVFVASLSNEDPGTSQIAQNFFGLRSDVVNATIGFPQQLDGRDIETFRKQIPANVANGIDACLKTCGIAKR